MTIAAEFRLAVILVSLLRPHTSHPPVWPCTSTIPLLSRLGLCSACSPSVCLSSLRPSSALYAPLLLNWLYKPSGTAVMPRSTDPDSVCVRPIGGCCSCLTDVAGAAALAISPRLYSQSNGSSSPGIVSIHQPLSSFAALNQLLTTVPPFYVIYVAFFTTTVLI